MRNRSKRRRGFTLIEILLVLAIIGMLAGVAIVSLVGTREGAKIDSTKAMLTSVETALETYNMHISHYPSEEEGNLNALLTKPTFENEQLGEKWRGPYLKQEARDSWGNLLNYELSTATTGETSTRPYRLWSNGPDGMDGTDDDIKNYEDESTTTSP
ncbi:MAG: type II secretion system major pseudopilin GspG [Planctomycetes bacterium]|nr:type II secretion system major pseudopilin GspG [Planctomycetota bacterium]